MKKLTPDDPQARSADVVADNAEHLRELFPEAFTEGRVDFDVLKQLLSGVLEERDEKYGLNWHGKRRARQLALTPSTGTLRPCPEESVDWGTTKNLMIEGDNLEVLKLLQKSYAGRVGVIYIDPPYNTGKDFVYPDQFKDSIGNYLELSGQAEGGARISSNTEASGRFHTDWLNMIYPRLKIARDLLAPEGVLFVSIDDRECARLLEVCCELFGEENHIATFVWRKKSSISYLAKDALAIHEYVLAFSRSKGTPLIDVMRWKESSDTVFHLFQAGNPMRERVIRKGARLKSKTVTTNSVMEAGTYEMPSHTVELLDAANFAEGVLTSDVRVHGRFTVGQELLDERPDIVLISPSGMMYQDKESSGTKAPLTLIDEPRWVTRVASKDLKALFDGKAVFDFPKPVPLVSYLTHLTGSPDGIVLDFFAGSGCTGHATMALNAGDGGSRRFILVQLPEPLEVENKNQQVAAAFCDELGRPRNIAELSKERLRRAARELRHEHPMFAGDLGFRVFKLDHSNIRAWNPSPADFNSALLDSVEHLREGRSEQDVLYELLLKLGLDLCVPIEDRTIAGKTVHSIGAGSLFVCLPRMVTPDEVEKLALGIAGWREELKTAGETTVVFRDSAFADDVAKTNASAILEQHGIENVRSL